MSDDTTGARPATRTDRGAPVRRHIATPASRPRALLAGTIAALATVAILTRGGTGWLKRDWFVDEAHKISEAVTYPALLRAAHHDPGWFDSPYVSVNPPLPKYVYAATILLSGHALPSGEPVRWVRRSARSLPPPGEEALYLGARGPLRLLSLAATALLAGSIAFVAARFGGTVAAIFSSAFFLMHHIPRAFGAVAMNDAPLALFAFGAVIPLAIVIARPIRSPAAAAVWAAVSGAIGAAAFQTKLNGSIAAAAAAATILLFFPRGTRLRSFVTFTGSAVVLVLLLNPWYWAAAPVPLERTPFSSAGPLLRPLDRFVLQVRASEDTMKPLQRARLTTAQERLAFARLVFWSPSYAKGMVAGVLLLLPFLRTQPKWLLFWAAGLTLGFVAWIPLDWTRYFFPVVGPLALLGGLGWNGAARQAIESAHRVPGSARP